LARPTGFEPATNARLTSSIASTTALISAYRRSRSRQNHTAETATPATGVASRHKRPSVAMASASGGRWRSARPTSASDVKTSAARPASRFWTTRITSRTCECPCPA